MGFLGYNDTDPVFTTNSNLRRSGSVSNQESPTQKSGVVRRNSTRRHGQFIDMDLPAVAEARKNFNGSSTHRGIDFTHDSSYTPLETARPTLRRKSAFRKPSNPESLASPKASKHPYRGNSLPVADNDAHRGITYKPYRPVDSASTPCTDKTQSTLHRTNAIRRPSNAAKSVDATRHPSRLGAITAIHIERASVVHMEKAKPTLRRHNAVRKPSNPIQPQEDHHDMSLSRVASPHPKNGTPRRVDPSTLKAPSSWL